MVPSFVIPPGVSPDEVARKRAISEKLMMQGLQSQPKTIGDGLGSIADMLLARGYHEASKRDSQRMNELGQQAVGMWMGNGGEPAQPATPQESYMPDGVSVAQVAPPAGAQGGNVPGVMPNVQPYNPQPQQQPNQTGIHVDQMAARRAFRNLTDDELLSNLMNPQLVQATEWLNPEIPKIAREELSRRWDALSEQQKQAFQDSQRRLKTEDERTTEAGKQGFGSFDEMQQGGGTWKARQEQRDFTDPGGIKFDETVAAQTAQMVPKYMEAAQKAATINSELEVMKEVLSGVQSGGLSGKLATMFPSIDAASAYLESRIAALAPAMRIEGSGSSSDSDVALMMSNYPSLKNDPTANALIIDMFSRKNAIDVERGRIASAMAANQMDRREGIMALHELNKQSVMSPELREKIRQVTSASGMKPDQQQRRFTIEPVQQPGQGVY